MDNLEVIFSDLLQQLSRFGFEDQTWKNDESRVMRSSLAGGRKIEIWVDTETAPFLMTVEDRLNEQQDYYFHTIEDVVAKVRPLAA